MFSINNYIIRYYAQAKTTIYHFEQGPQLRDMKYIMIKQEIENEAVISMNKI